MKFVRLPFFYALVLWAFFLSSLSCSQEPVKIRSYILRDRVVVTDQVLLKKALYVFISVDDEIRENRSLLIKGELKRSGKVLSRALERMNDEKFGNLLFDLPAKLLEGKYTIIVTVLNVNGDFIAKTRMDVPRSSFKSTWTPDKVPTKPLPVYSEKKPADRSKWAKIDLSKTCEIIYRSPLSIVQSTYKPSEYDSLKNLSVSMARNEYEVLTFSLFSSQNMGEVKVSVSNLKNNGVAIPRKDLEWTIAKPVQVESRSKIRELPIMLEPAEEVVVTAFNEMRFWLKLRVRDNTVPGTYRGKIIVSPEYGNRKTIPLEITVSDVTLEDVPGVDYSMLMTYEFTELTMPWNEADKRKIYDAGVKILEDYRAHGMTTLSIHSPFVYMTKEDGSPNLDDILAGLHAAKEAGFSAPIIWYLGHLIQTSKPKHPGNIIGFDKNVHIQRLINLVEYVTTFSKENDLPEIIFLPIDEADDASQDYRGIRQTISPLLIDTIKSRGGKSMITARSFSNFRNADYWAASTFDPRELAEARVRGRKYWLYNNAVTTRCLNPAYARYIYGYYTWKKGVDGMSSWTFQNTQNASGWPTRSDASGRDLYLAYPAPDGPLSTPRWEAIREGIDDHKLIYQLEKRIKRLRVAGLPASHYKNLLRRIDAEVEEPPCNIDEVEDESIHLFEQFRKCLFDAINQADWEIKQVQREGFSSEAKKVLN